MANPNRTRVVTFNTGRIVEKIRGAKKKAGLQLAREMQKKLRATIGVQGTPKTPSLPGRPPKRQSGQLYKTTFVKYRRSKLVVVTTQKGIWLEGGTSKMDPRPHIDPVIRKQRRTWERRWRALMRQAART